MSIQVYRGKSITRFVLLSMTGDQVQITIAEDRCGIVVLPQQFGDMASEGIIDVSDVRELGELLIEYTHHAKGT